MTNKPRITAQEFLRLQAEMIARKSAAESPEPAKPQEPQHPLVIRRDSDLWAV